MKTEDDFRDFLHRHGKAVQHPKKEGLFLFASGAVWHNEGLRSQARAEEPENMPPERRLSNRKAYFERLGEILNQRLNNAYASVAVETMRAIVEELRDAREKFAQASAEYEALPEIQELRKREEEEMEREIETAQAEQAHHQRMRAEADRIMAEFRSAGPVPVAVSHDEVAAALNPAGAIVDKLNEAVTLAAARQAGVAVAMPRRRSRTTPEEVAQ